MICKGREGRKGRLWIGGGGIEGVGFAVLSGLFGVGCDYHHRCPHSVNDFVIQRYNVI